MTTGVDFLPPGIRLGWEHLVAVLGVGGVGGFLTALIQRRSKKETDASAAKDTATGEAALITAMATGFTQFAGGLHEEIDRLQKVAGDFRDSAAQFEAELRAASLRVSQLEDDLAGVLRELERVTGERNDARARIEQLEGEVRQLNQVLASRARAEVTG